MQLAPKNLFVMATSSPTQVMSLVQKGMLEDEPNLTMLYWSDLLKQLPEDMQAALWTKTTWRLSKVTSPSPQSAYTTAIELAWRHVFSSLLFASEAKGARTDKKPEEWAIALITKVSFRHDAVIKRVLTQCYSSIGMLDPSEWAHIIRFILLPYARSHP